MKIVYNDGCKKSKIRNARKVWREQNDKQCRKNVCNTKDRSIKPDRSTRQGNSMFELTEKIFEPGLWTTGYGLWIRNYGLHLDNNIWAINSGMSFFFWHYCKANAHIFFLVYITFLQVLHILNSLKITKTLTCNQS